MKQKCLFLLLAAGLLGHATGQARIVTKSKIGRPIKQNSEIAAPYVEPTAVKGSKSVGVADSIANLTGATDVIWHAMSGPGGRNLGIDASSNLTSVYARASGRAAAPFILMQGYSYDGGSTWASSELFPGDTLRRVYSAVTVDAQGWPHFACQYGKTTATSGSPIYCGFGLAYLRDEAGIGGGLPTIPWLINDSTKATGTTPYNPNIEVRGSAGESIWIAASDYAGVYADLSDDSHLGALSTDGGASWKTTPPFGPDKWFLPAWTEPNYAYIDGPALCVSDDGKNLFSMVYAGGVLWPTIVDTIMELPYYYYSNDSGTTWQYGGALNTADTTVPRAGLAGVAGGWWHLGATTMDHNGIVHCLWTSSGSSKAVNVDVDTIEYDPLVHSYNNTPGDYSSWNHEIVGNPAVLDYANNIMTGWHDFATITVTPWNDLVFLFVDATDTLGYAGLYAQLKASAGTLYTPKLINAIDGINVGSWPETPHQSIGSTIHITWGKGGDTWSNVTALMHSKVTVYGGVTEEPGEKYITYGFNLKQNYPNPIANRTNISFSLPKAGQYKLRIYNISGQLVKILDGMGQAGKNTINWDCRDGQGKTVSNGMYFYSLQAGGNRATKKMIVLR